MGELLVSIEDILEETDRVIAVVHCMSFTILYETLYEHIRVHMMNMPFDQPQPPQLIRP